jgi:arabinan endo-1,5-alpha-L-arabinosidase
MRSKKQMRPNDAALKFARASWSACGSPPLWISRPFIPLLLVVQTIAAESNSPLILQSPSRFESTNNIRLHDPSTIIAQSNTYHLFYTGRGLPSYTSTNLQNWTPGPRVFTNSPAWVTNIIPQNRGGLDFWAPDIIHHNNRYLVYYSVSSFGKNTSAIALASNKTLDPASPDYTWTDEGIVIQSASTNDFNAIDPAVTLDKENRLWLSFGSFWSGIKVVELDPLTGKRKADAPLHSIARKREIEAPFIYQHDNHYYLFVNWGFCCRGTNSTYNIRIGRAEKITGPYLDKDGRDLNEGGGTLLLASEDTMIGPGHAGIIKVGDQHHFSYHFYDATQRGRPTLAVRPLNWDAQGWPILPQPAKTNQ